MPDIPHLPEVTIYTDGGADPNPGTGGWAAILLDKASGKVRELSGGEPRATNKRMELTADIRGAPGGEPRATNTRMELPAAIRGLEALKRPCRVHLLTDSLYLRKGITE